MSHPEDIQEPGCSGVSRGSPHVLPEHFTRERVRAIVHVYFQSGYSAAGALEAIQDAYAAYGNLVSRSTVYDLFHQFREGRERMTDAPRPGRPRVGDMDLGFLKSIVTQAPQIGLTELASIFGIGRTTVRHRLKEIGYRKRRPVGYHYMPDAADLDYRVDVCVGLLGAYPKRSLRRIITCLSLRSKTIRPDLLFERVTYSAGNS
ncbi:uncharacterized protein LOC143219938 [Lasioglossum baleicum]|uniref:uncharacterized protein LOC143219938 n=1 Tax=Lasioglossum baleicum TaxID=434251 RepID=UPI003FCDB525